MKSESLHEIGSAIQKRTSDEYRNRYINVAVARFLCHMTSTVKTGLSGKNEIFLTNKQDLPVSFVKDFTGTGTQIVKNRKTTSNIGRSVYKNTKLGGLLIENYYGTFSYKTPTVLKGRYNDVTCEIIDRATYDYNGGNPTNLEVVTGWDKKKYHFGSINAILQDKLDEAKKALEAKQQELKRQQEEAARLKRLAEQEAREAEEKARLEAQRIEEERKAKEIQNEVKRLEAERAKQEAKLNSFRAYLRKGVDLRSQHILDPYQEDAKRSHLYDGVPIVIDGGPGTGKTTTVIQRLKFLLSRQALHEYEAPLSNSQIEYLTDPNEWNDRWLFFSPTDLLLQYLRKNMLEEELIATDSNTRTLPRFRKTKMREYGLIDPSKNSPFKSYKTDDPSPLILLPMAAISGFEQYVIDSICNDLKKRLQVKTSEFSWNQYAIRIKAAIQNRASATTLEAVITLLSSLQDDEGPKVREVLSGMKDLVDIEAVKIKQSVSADEELVKEIQQLFDSWKNDRNSEPIEEEDIDSEEDINIEDILSNTDFQSQLFEMIKKIIRKKGLKIFDSKTNLTKREQELSEIIEKHIDESIKVKEIGELMWFRKQFYSICTGAESNLISKLPKFYKEYRKKLLSENSDVYNIGLLETIVKKENNKHLHPEEQNLVLGFINNLFYRLATKSRRRFDSMNKLFIQKYRESVRPVLGIDEATDYSVLDYYLMLSFRHYEFNSVTLCGDMMQGLNDNGISSWNELKETLLDKLEVKTLNISYRQLPALVDLSKEMYKDEIGHYPAYDTSRERPEDEPNALLYINDDDEAKAEWISYRIVEIFNSYDKELPSIAIFVGDDVNIDKFIERIEDCDILNGIEVVDCSNGKKLDSKEVVRVFRLSEVKGMEFDAVFFYDLDKAIAEHSSSLMRRYLYVGVSRAASHLAAILSSNQNNGDLKKYFKSNSNW